MKKIVTGWITTLIGLCLIVMAGLDFFGIIQVPAPEGVSKHMQLIVAAILGFALFLIGPTPLEQIALQLITKFTGFFGNGKTDNQG